MAVVHQRKRTLQNPPKRRRAKRNAARPKLSDKQIKFFGTSAQRAALKRRRSSARKVSAPVTHRRRRRPKTNPGEIVRAALGALKNNPGRKSPKKRGTTVAATKRRKRAAAKSSHAPTRRRRRATSNPHRRRSRRPRTNPSPVRNVGGFLANAAYMIAGAVGSKAVSQAVLGANNTGFIGYGANLIAAFAIGKLVGMFTKNKQAENSAILGGVGQVVLRFLIDKTPYGSKLKDAGFGDYQFQSSVYPQRLSDGMRSAEVAIPSAWRPGPALMPAAAAASTSGVAGLRNIGRGLY